ncbi:hypothetical protein DSM3645_03423 [Blastopirellula marina DSM 3645]|uniref:Uncharacterized protein n=1 Tax=Blastopirellula marina DSM 3645 TaxID=314230 RepID=A3ZVZ8_9BACT|nr:hypothetical protein DSM3645_03423 [Blastopirellula marina DSM 3645]
MPSPTKRLRCPKMSGYARFFATVRRRPQFLPGFLELLRHARTRPLRCRHRESKVCRARPLSRIDESPRVAADARLRRPPLCVEQA